MAETGPSSFLKRILDLKKPELEQTDEHDRVMANRQGKPDNGFLLVWKGLITKELEMQDVPASGPASSGAFPVCPCLTGALLRS
jgi:hypothetical protein